MTPHPPSDTLTRPLLLSYAMLLVMLALSALDQTIVSTALPSIARDLKGTAQMSWVFSAYLIAATVAVPVYGKLGDLYGTRPVLLTAVSLFLLGSLLCGLSPRMDGLILARGLQGAGGGGLLTLAMMAVGRMFTSRLRARLQGMMGAAYGLSTMAGPLAGGFLVEHFSWRWAFFINLPVGMLALACLAWVFPQHQPAHRVRMDYLGAALLAACLLSLLLSTHPGEVAGVAWSSPTFGTLGLGLALVFAWTQIRSVSPLLPPSLFAHRGFSTAVALSASSGFTLFAAVVFMPLYFQTARGMSPESSGWHLMPLMGGITAGSIGCGRLLAATGRVRPIALAGCALSALTFASLGFLLQQPDCSLGLLSAALVPLGVGLGVLFPLVTVVAQTSAAPALMGIATASPVMFRSVAGALGASALGALFARDMASQIAGGTAVVLAFGRSLGAVFWVAATVSVLAGALTSGMPARLQRPGA